MAAIKGTDSTAGAVARRLERQEVRHLERGQEVKKGEQSAADKAAAEEAAKVAKHGWLAKFAPQPTSKIESMSMAADGPVRTVVGYTGDDAGRVLEKQKMPEADRKTRSGWTPETD